jgi:hypothetical protein
MTAVTTGIPPAARDPELPPDPGVERGTRPAFLRRRVRRSQVVAVTTLLALPLLVFALPALLGHPVVPGDDLTQNLPLRELVGRDLRAGALPTFDPYIWSGAPLLAGWNAGAAYPLTWAFAVLPGTAAWTLNLVTAAAVAGLGCYFFLRASRLSVLSSWAGALTFAYGGGMVAQVPHVGLVIGMSWVPLSLLAILHVTDPDPAVGFAVRIRWTVALAVTVGLVILAGEPRAVTDASLVWLLYAAWRVARLQGVSWRATAAAVGGIVSGAALGIGLGAVQLVPGLEAVASSQRAHVSSFLFGAGSLPVHWLALLGVPDLLGGSGSFGQPPFFASYNLTEVTGYVGLLPLAAATALFARLRRRQRLPDWLLWEAVALAGVLVTLGNNTPLWHVLIHIPLIGGQRLQSRGILVADLALAVLLAYWLDEWARRPSRRAEQVLGALPLAGVIGIVVAGLVAGASLLGWLGVGAHDGARAGALRPWLMPALVLAALALVLVAGGSRLAPTLRGALAASFVVVDLVIFSMTTVVAIGAPGSPGVAVGPAHATSPAGQSGSRIRPISTLHLSGRFAVYDPGLADQPQLEVLGVPDASALDGTWSVQGYGSIVDGRYARIAGVHGVSGTGQDVFAPAAAANGVFDALSVQVVLSPSRYLRSATGTASATGSAGARHLHPGRRSTWFLGAPLPVRAAQLEVDLPRVDGRTSARPVRAGLLTEVGRIDWARMEAPRAVGSGTQSAATGSMWNAVWPSAVEAVGLVVVTDVPASLAPPLVTDTAGTPYRLDGVLQSALLAPHWRYGGEDGAFTVFVDSRRRPPLSLRARAGATLHGAVVRRVSGPALEPAAAFVSSSRGVDVVRAVADVPGWSATWTPTRSRGAAAQALPIRRSGAVQVVAVPPGRGTLRWSYSAPGLFVGELLSAAAVAVLALLLFVVFAVDRAGSRRRREGGLLPTVGPCRRTRTSRFPVTTPTSGSCT